MKTKPDFKDLPPSPTTYTYPGAKWWRIEFHAHTPKSCDYGNRAGPAKDAIKQRTAKEWLFDYMSWGVDAVVVTDHNSTAFIPELQRAYQEIQKDQGFRPLVIFPGFELSVNGGLHLIGVFDPTSDIEVVSGVISACGYNGERGSTNSVSDQSFVQCIKKYVMQVD